VWMLSEIEALADARNDAIHSPILSFTNYDDPQVVRTVGSTSDNKRERRYPFRPHANLPVF